MIGKIIKLTGGFYYIKCGDEIVETRARGNFRHLKVEPIVGDEVEFKYDNKTLGYIEKIYPRKNILKRPKVSNVDLAVVVVPVRDPEPNLMLIDKMIVQFEEAAIDILVVINKIDLDYNRAEEIAKIYVDAGFDVLKISTKTGENIEELKSKLKNKLTALCGVSAAGKSSICSVLFNREINISEVSNKTKRGRHTTRHVELLYDNNFYIFDTPGFSALKLDLEKEDLSHYFREFEKYLGQCKFNNCNHINEPQCKIKEKVNEGSISEIRYYNYSYLFKEIEDEKGVY